MDQPPQLLPRVGTFLILVGIGLSLMFTASYLGGEIKFNYLLYTLAAFGLGILLRRRAKRSDDSGRFRAVRGIYDKSKERREEKQQQKKQKK
ncbi:MAG: hypothetical protein QMD04_09870 [Anaerolineales bacterium]|nr:hypothetical protein [Anaerolineales bacterium]